MQDDNKRLKHDVGNLGYKIKNQRKEIEHQIAQNTKFKEELKEICEKYLKIKTTVSAYEDACKDLRAYIKKLKELLKECQHILEEQNFYRNTPIETDTTYRTRCLKKQELLTKIDEVLQELLNEPQS